MADKSVVGLEITERYVRAAEIRKPGSSSPTLVACGEVELPEGAASDSEVHDKDAVALALRHLWEESRISSKKVILGIANRRVLVRDFVAPLLPLDQIKQSLPFQVQNMLPVPVDQAVLDFYPVREVETETGPGVEGLLVSAVAEMVEDLVDTVQRAKLDVRSIDLSPFGMARAAARTSIGQQSTLVTHIGVDTSYVMVINAGIPRFVRMVAGGIAMRDVEGSEGGGRRRAKAATSAFDDIMMRVGGTYEFYASRNADRPVTAIVAAGEGSAHPDLIDSVQEIVGQPGRQVRLKDIVTVSGKVPPMDDVTELALVAPVGIALGGAK